MNAQDRNKLKNAGYRIFRKRQVCPVTGAGRKENEIWELSNQGSWCKFKRYESQVEMDRAWKEIMKNDMCISDQGGME